MLATKTLKHLVENDLPLLSYSNLQSHFDINIRVRNINIFTNVLNCNITKSHSKSV